MYYVLFNYLRGRREGNFKALRSEDEVIEFVCEKHKEIQVYRILLTSTIYNLGLISADEGLIPGRIIKPEDPEDPEEEEEEIQEVMEKADEAIKKAEDKQLDPKLNWKKCKKCKTNKVAPWSRSGICSPCQQKPRTKDKK